MNATATAIQKAPVDPAIGAAIEVYERLNVIRNVLAPDLSDQELQLFAIVAERSRLDPFAKQIYAIKRKGRVTFQTGIDGFRSSAEETDEYRGSDEPVYGPIVDKPFPHPEFASVTVHRQFANGEWLHQPATVYFDEMYPGDDQGFQWRKMPRVMIAKCAEAAAFRKAFPKRFSDVYTPEEMAQADAADMARPVGATAAERIAARRADLEAGGSAVVSPGSTDQAHVGGTEAVVTPTADVSTPAPTNADHPAARTPCPVRSPRGALCDLPAGHGDTHKRANVTWPTPNQQSGGSASQPSHDEAEPVQGHAPVASEDTAGAVSNAAAPADLVEDADFREVAAETLGDLAKPTPPPVMAGEFDPNLQAGMDLLAERPTRSPGRQS